MLLLARQLTDKTSLPLEHPLNVLNTVAEKGDATTTRDHICTHGQSLSIPVHSSKERPSIQSRPNSSSQFSQTAFLLRMRSPSGVGDSCKGDYKHCSCMASNVSIHHNLPYNAAAVTKVVGTTGGTERETREASQQGWRVQHVSLTGASTRCSTMMVVWSTERESRESSAGKLLRFCRE